MSDYLGYFIHTIMLHLRDIFSYVTGIQPHFDFGDPIMHALFMVAYIFSVYLIAKFIIGVVRWFYRI